MRYARSLLFAFAATALVLAAGCVSIDVREDHFFHPGPAATASPVTAGEAPELRTDDGTQLHGLYIRQPQAKVDVLYFGGNEFHLDDHAAAMAETMPPGIANFVSFDYRGYGRSGGVPTIETLKSDGLAIFD